MEERSSCPVDVSDAAREEAAPITPLGPSFQSPRCTVCGEPIPAARLCAMPGATTCVPCLEEAGDIPKIRRFDQATNDGVVETYFQDDEAIERELHRVNASIGFSINLDDGAIPATPRHRRPIQSKTLAAAIYQAAQDPD